MRISGSTAKSADLHRVHKRRSFAHGLAGRGLATVLALSLGCGPGSSSDSGSLVVTERGAAGQGGGSTPKPLKFPPDPITPTAETAKLAGGGGVSASGAYQYSIPLWVPAGRAQMQPSLGLGYSSRTGNGTLGVGWELNTGTTAISRCNKVMGRDGATDNPQFTADDNFCLGAQKLVPVSDKEVGKVSDRLIAGQGKLIGEYRTEQESFARVFAFGTDGPTNWLVLRRSGRVEYYGDEAGAQAKDLRFEGGLGEATLAWHLTHVHDRVENEVRYRWVEDPSSSARRLLDEIEYTISDQGPYAGSATRSVRFHYEDRPDDIDAWVNGVNMRTSQRLASVEMWAPNPEITERVRSYKLTYEDSKRSGRSLLSEVTECDAFGSCVKPTTFEYAEPSFGAVDYRSTSTSELSGISRPWFTDLQVFDVNGDGLDDVIYDAVGGAIQGTSWVPTFHPRLRLSNALGSSPLEPEIDLANLFTYPSGPLNPDVGVQYRRGFGSSASRLDSDGDGVLEWAAMIHDYGVAKLRRFTFDEQLGSLRWAVGNDLTCTTNHCSFAPLDFDGDGKVDIAQHSIVHQEDVYGNVTAHSSELEILLGDGDGRMDSSQFSMSFGDDVLGSSAIDLGGNGRADVVPLYDDDHLSEFGLGSGSTYHRQHNPDSLHMGSFADVNGDGLVDLVWPFGRPYAVSQPNNGPQGSGNNSGATGPEVSINTGNGFKEAFATAAISWPTIHDGRRFDEAAIDLGFETRIADFNSDGRDDILILRASADPDDPPPGPEPLWRARYVYDEDEPLMLLLSEGDRFILNPLDQPETMAWHPIMGWAGTKLGDVDGDGRPEILSVSHHGFDRLIEPRSCHPDESTQSSTYTYCYDGFRIRIGYQNELASRSDAYDKIIKVTDGFGATEEVGYDRGAPTPGAPDPTHTPSRDCQAPDHCLTNVGDVVRDHWVGPRRQSYRYHGARASRTGRGPVGFERVVSTDYPSGATTEVVYDLTRSDTSVVGEVYPLAGLPIMQSTTITGDKEWEQRVESDYEVVYLSNRYYVMATERHSTVSEDGALRSETFETLTHDAFANLESRTLVNGHSVEATANFYENRVEDWLIGLPTRVESTSVAHERSRTRTTAQQYDDHGLIAMTIVEPDDPSNDSAYSELAYFRDASGLVRVSEHRDANGNSRQASMDYGPHGVSPASITDALGHVTQTLYHPGVDQVVATSDANGAETVYLYDGIGRPTGVEHPTGLVETVDYLESDLAIDIATSTNAGSTTRQSYDTELRLLEERWSGFGGNDVIVDYNYDAYGRVTSASHPRFDGEASSGAVTTAYDVMGRIKSVERPDGTHDTWTYPQLGTTEHTDAEGRILRTRESADGLFGTTQREDAGLTYTTNTYRGPFGLVTRVDGLVGNTGTAVPKVEMTYDVRGRRVDLIDPNLGAVHHTYNAFGEVVKQVAANGATRSFVYDDIGRLLTRTTEDGVDTFEWGTVAGTRGALIEANSADDVLWRGSYNAIGQLTGESYEQGPESWTINQTYDAVGRPAVTEYPMMPDNRRATVGRDYANGMLVRITEQVTGQSLYSVDKRDAESRIVESRRGNAIHETRSYDPLTRRLEQHQASSPTSGTLLDLGYTYYDDGRIASKSDAVAQITDTSYYDDIGRLTQWTTDRAGDVSSHHYAFDTAGRLASVQRIVPGSWQQSPKIYSYPSLTDKRPHAATKIGDETYKFDELGRETLKFVNGDLQREIDYTYRNLPRSISYPAGVTKFDYDHAGRRFRKSSSEGERVFVGGLYERLRANGKETHRMNVPGPEGLVAVLEWKDSGPTVFEPTYVLTDERGATAVSVSSDGQQADPLFYEPFGRRITADGTSPNPGQSIQPLPGYSGHLYDDELELVNMKGRMFDPVARRFVTPDPVLDNLESGRGLDRYGLVGYDPINKVDPTGFEGQHVEFGDDYLIGKRPPSDSAPSVPALPSLPLPNSMFGEEPGVILPGAVITFGPPAPVAGGSAPAPHAELGGDFWLNKWPILKNSTPSNPVSPAFVQRLNDKYGSIPGIPGVDYHVGPARGQSTEEVLLGLGALSVVMEGTGVLATVAWIPDVIAAVGYFSIGDTTSGWLSLAAAVPLAGILVAGVGATRQVVRASRAAGGRTFEIVDGVRRSKAAELAGQSSIRAEVHAGGKVVETLEIPLSQLRSPNKAAIDVSSSQRAMDRWKSVMDATTAGKIKDPIIVQRGSRGPSIFEVLFR